MSFTVQPESVIQAEGLEAVFECLHPEATAYGWALNGAFLLNFPVDIDIDSPSGDSPARLIIPATPQYNNTVVQCRAIIEEEGDFRGVLSCPALLVLQREFI